MIELLNEKAPIKIHELFLAVRLRELLTVDFAIWEGRRTYPAATCEKISSRTLSGVILLLMSAKAMSLSGLIPSFDSFVRKRREKFPIKVCHTKFAKTYILFGEQGGGAAATVFARM
jgi:hypothetical protein